MNYVPALSTVCCESCGDEGPVESFSLYRYELICPTCREDHDARTEQSRAAEFRWQSGEWFRTSEQERQPFMLRLQFGGY